MKNYSLLLFVVIVFFISFADAIMSYVSPIFIEEKVNSAFLMGIIFSFSSVVGIICDILFPKIFTNRPHYFFLKATLLSAVIFPLSYLLFPNHVITFLIAMAVWGIYYELNLFSTFHFIDTYIHIQDHSKSWATIHAVQSSAYALAPLLAVKLLLHGYTINFVFVCALLGLAILLTLIFKTKFTKKHNYEEKIIPVKKSWVNEYNIWKLLAPKVWYLLIIEMLLTTIDASFWTVGTLLTQELSQQHELGQLFITAHIAPSIAVGFVLSKISINSNKKKIALTSSIISGLLLSGLFVSESIPTILLLVALASIFSGIAYPELRATFENFVSRLKDKDNEMIGLQASSTSMAYIIGPIIATFLASVVGYKLSFAVLGAVLAVSATIVIFIIPKKIKMPQKELARI